MKIVYEPRNFRDTSLAIIDQANVICEDYAARGYDLTLRQLYYRFVAQALIPNTDQSYNRLGAIVSDARLAGLIDWNHIVDRTRYLRALPSWGSPAEIIDGAAEGYREDVWADQPEYVEVWVEKDALIGVVEQAADAYKAPSFSCRGYTSQSELWAAARRHVRMMHRGKRCTVLHLGDHDPSGIDMTRDIEDRLALFCSRHGSGRVRVERLALNMDQVAEYQPPPNPAKMTDSRYEGYMAVYGDESWELDALPPDVLDGIIQANLRQHLDVAAYDRSIAGQEERRVLLRRVSAQWEDVANY